MTHRFAIIGAGIGGLTAAGYLARVGMDVTVLEAHAYPGGCAGTFYHQGYRFDAGATLSAGFYPQGPMDLVAKAVGIDRWPIIPADLAMLVHLPDGTRVHRWTGEARWEERRKVFGPSSEAFWRWQEATADVVWALALAGLPWPPQSMNELATLLSRSLPPLFQRRGILGLGEFALDALRPVKAHLEGTSSRLRRFVDAQLLISAQTLADGANALYAAAALDLPRRGVVHMSGGMGALADSLVSALKRNGGKIRYRKRVTRLHRSKGQPFILETKDGEAIQADIVIANLPSENLNALLSNTDGTHPGDLPLSEEPRWGAFSLHLGIDGALIPEPFPTHHQVIVDEPLAEGNSIFLSLSPEWDETRAPEGMRAISISTHTRLKPWWELFKENVREYENQKARYTERVIAATERILPGIREATQLTLPGTPITFQRFTGRAGGWVGGFPQRHLFSSERPRRGKRIWMVGDSIFPGQSTAAVALGGLRVAYLTLDELRVEALGPSYEMGLAAGAPPFATKRRACEI